MISKKAKSGFTLVELLVVIGIIAVLIGILLPALSKARTQARRTQDLSNIHQIVIACVAYAAESKGLYPVGSRGGPDLTVANDDIAWINGYTFATFLQTLRNRAMASQWFAATSGAPVVMDDATKKIFSCTSLYNNTSVLSEVGDTTYSPYETKLGYYYWGRRANTLSGNVYTSAGVLAVPTLNYVFPLQQGDHPTSQTLITCPAFAGSNYGWMPHYTTGDSFREGATATSGTPTTNDKLTQPMQGICVGYTDGSARWVPRKQLWSMHEGNWAAPYYNLMYFDKTNP
jgi:prepilin-type N-terminal cleavage/methylation domain-containing protein